MKNRLKFYLPGFLYLALSFNLNAQEPAKSKAPLKKTESTSPEIKYKYETVKNDPLNTRIYKLENGLTVYMTVYKDAPRVQTYIATKAGSKNDPSDATGLAHYLEHMLFKGTDKYGSKDYAKEAALLKQIEDLYETYRATTDEQQRKIIYHVIDSVSGVASKSAIANEYDKMLASIGASGTNAYTSVEQTVYVNDIPSNQVEKWIDIESERFRNPVLRLFHTELEAVYEEKNRGLDNDGNKAWEAMEAALWQKHSYGTQTTIGTIDHLKNPSLKKIKEYYDKYYVPNNMAICLSGDFNPDETIKAIDKKFGVWKSKPVPSFVSVREDAITQPIVREVLGPDAETMMLAYRFAGAGSKDADMITIINKILSNGKAGLIDLNLNQSQKVLGASSQEMIMKDYSAHVFGADPKEGQKLEAVKDLLLSQIELVKKGEFPDWLLPAIINDFKLQKTKEYEKNSSRADAFVNSFVLDIPWQNYVNTIDRLSLITKQEIMDFAKANYNNNYVVVYKRTGEDKNVQKVVKPSITPVDVNRDDQSPFVKELVGKNVPSIEPVFLNYEKDIQSFNIKNNIPVLYTENKENKTFDLYYILDMGSNNNKKLGVAISYLEFLGTSKLSPAQVQEEFYKLGCSYSVFNSEDQIYVSLSGLSENFDKALQLFEELLSDAQPNKEALISLEGDILKMRNDAKLNKGAILWSAMYNYGVYGSTSPYTNILSENEIKELNPEELISIIKEISSYEHRILYYGTKTPTELTTSLNSYHKTPEKLKPLPAPIKFEERDTHADVYVVDYDMKQAEIIMLSKGAAYDKAKAPAIALFNEYFGGGMSSVVFQDMRESKALAYSVFSSMKTPKRKEKPYYVVAYIGTQADKLPEAMAGMKGLMNNMPEADLTLSSAKDAVIQNIKTERITKANVLFNYEKAKKMGLDYDIRKDIFSKVPSMTMADVKAFEQQYVKNNEYTILVLGDKKTLDVKTLETYGKVQFLTLKDVFGY